MQRIFFFHIPKTAGTSVSQYFLSRIPRKHVFIGGSPAAPVEIAREHHRAKLYYAAHMAWEEYSRVDFRHKSFTFLRDPRKRLVSSYYFVRNADADESRMSEQAKATRRYNLGDWLQYCLDGAASDQGQNNGSDNAYMRIFLGRSIVTPMPRLGFDLDGPEMALAYQRLRQFNCVGIVEDFDNSLKMIGSAMGLTPPTAEEFVPKNRTVDRGNQDRDPMTDKIEDAITELCRYDQKLYDYGRELYALQQQAY